MGSPLSISLRIIDPWFILPPMGKKSRSKGQRGERQVAEKFSEWWGTEFTRTPSSGGFRTPKFRDDWNAAGDIVTPDPSFPYCVEVKNQEGWHLEQLLTASECSIVKWWRQAVEETPEGKQPFLAFTRNRQPWFFMMLKSDFINLPYTEDTCFFTMPVDSTAVVGGLLDDFFKVVDAEKYER